MRHLYLYSFNFFFFCPQIIRNKIREKIVCIEGEIEDLDEKKRALEDRQKAIERDEKKLQLLKKTETNLKNKLEAYEKKLYDYRIFRRYLVIFYSKGSPKCLKSMFSLTY